MGQLQDLFQTHAIVKILDHLTLYPGFEYTKTDIARETGISRRTLYEVWPILERFELVQVTKSSGIVKFFKLNTANPISKSLILLADRISFFDVDKTFEIAEELTIEQPKISPSQSQDSVEFTRRSYLIEEKIRGTPSQVKELLHGIEVTNGEMSTTIADSTGSDQIGERVFRLHKKMGDQYGEQG